MKSIAFTNPRSGVLLALAALALPALAVAQAAGAGDVRSEVVAGAQGVSDVSQRGAARFNEFRDVADDAVFEFGRVMWAPHTSRWLLSVTAVDAAQDDERYFLDWTKPGTFSLQASYRGMPRYYSSASTTLWTGGGTGALTVNEAFRQASEAAGGAPTQPVAPSTLDTLMQNAVAASGQPLSLRTQRNASAAGLDWRLSDALSLGLSGRYETRSGTRPRGIGTYIRRQALAGIPGTGPGTFWRETIEPRGQEVIEPLDYRVSELGAALTWAMRGHTAVLGWQGSWFRNDIDALYFDNPFEATVGRASAATFDPTSDQEPAAPNGNNNFRGLYSRSAIGLAPDNDYSRLYGRVSLKLPARTRFGATVSYGMLRQNVPFLPYAANDQVVFSGTAGQPGVVYATDAPLPQASLDGKMDIVQADFRLTSRLTSAFTARAGYRLYDLTDDRPRIDFPGYASSSDSYFRRGIGQRDSLGNRVLFNEIGGYTRQRMDAGAAYRFGWATVDAEYQRTTWDYEHRQVAGTAEDGFTGTLRLRPRALTVDVFFHTASREYDGAYEVGLETSGVRAYDVWTRDRTRVGVQVDVPLGPDLALSGGAHTGTDEYPGTPPDTLYPYGYGLQDTKSSSVFGGVTWSNKGWALGAWAGLDTYEWNSLQVTKTGLTADYDPDNRWTRASSDDVFWVGLDLSGALTNALTLRADVDYQQFTGTWQTANLSTPDVNSAVAYPFPEFKESTLTTRFAVLWALTAGTDVEFRYAFEPYRLTDFTWDAVQPYPQGVLEQTQSAPDDIGDMNASRLLWLDSRYSDYTAHVVSLLLHLRF